MPVKGRQRHTSTKNNMARTNSVVEFNPIGSLRLARSSVLLLALPLALGFCSCKSPRDTGGAVPHDSAADLDRLIGLNANSLRDRLGSPCARVRASNSLRRNVWYFCPHIDNKALHSTPQVPNTQKQEYFVTGTYGLFDRKCLKPTLVVHLDDHGRACRVHEGDCADHR